MSKATRNIIILLTAAFLLITIAKSFHYSIEYGGSDLRSRTVGSRLLPTAHSPYFYQWKQGDSELFLDPNVRPDRIVNGNVATPALLYAVYPLSQLSYPTIRFAWTILQILAGLATIYLVIKRTGGLESMEPQPISSESSRSESRWSDSRGSDSRDSDTGEFVSGSKESRKFEFASLKSEWLRSPGQFFAYVIVVLGLFCSEAFLYHVERGQVYVFFALFFAISYYFFNASFKHHEFVSGFVGGIFVLFRPIAAVIGLGFLINGKYKWLFGFATGIIIGCLLFVAPRPSLWQDYFSAMKTYNSEMLVKKETQVEKERRVEKEMLVEKETQVEKERHLEKAMPAKPENHLKPDTIGKSDGIFTSAMINGKTSASLPENIEGSVNVGEIKTFNIDGLQPIQVYLTKLNVEFTNLHSVLLYATLVCLLTLAYFRLSKRSYSPKKLYLFAFLLYILAELCMIAPRSGYNIIEWMFPLGLIYISIKNSAILVIGLLTAVVMLHGFPIILPYQSAFAEVGMIAVLIFAVLRKRRLNGLDFSQSG